MLPYFTFLALKNEDVSEKNCSHRNAVDPYL